MRICNWCQKDLPMESYEFLVDYGFHRHSCRVCVAEFKEMLSRGSKKHKQRKREDKQLCKLLNENYHDSGIELNTITYCNPAIELDMDTYLQDNIG